MSLCPFCGVVTDTPHESQQGCVAALGAEVARLRAVLDHVHSARVPARCPDERRVPPSPDDGEPGDPATVD